MSTQALTALIVGLSALTQALVAALRERDEVTEEQIAQVRAAHSAALAETERLSPVPEPPQ